jgi:hypothetical protein
MHSDRHIDKKHESNQQMLLRFGKQFAVLFFLILMFDSLLDWFFEFIDFTIELAHIFIELIEYSIEILLEHVLHTNHQESSTIIVNSAIIIAIYGAYRLFRATPRFLVRIKRNILAVWLRYLRRKSSYWRSLTLIHKIKLVSLYFFGFACLISLVTI